MLEERRAVIADLHVIGVGVEPDGRAVVDGGTLLVRDELAPVDHHPLASAPRRGQAPVARTGHEAVAQVERQAAGCEGSQLPVTNRSGKTPKEGVP